VCASAIPPRFAGFALVRAATVLLGATFVAIGLRGIVEVFFDFAAAVFVLLLPDGAFEVWILRFVISIALSPCMGGATGIVLALLRTYQKLFFGNRSPAFLCELLTSRRFFHAILSGLPST
jgi:hypothetical protein